MPFVMEASGGFGRAFAGTGGIVHDIQSWIRGQKGLPETRRFPHVSQLSVTLMRG